MHLCTQQRVFLSRLITQRGEEKRNPTKSWFLSTWQPQVWECGKRRMQELQLASQMQPCQAEGKKKAFYHIFGTPVEQLVFLVLLTLYTINRPCKSLSKKMRDNIVRDFDGSRQTKKGRLRSVERWWQILSGPSKGQLREAFVSVCALMPHIDRYSQNLEQRLPLFNHIWCLVSSSQQEPFPREYHFS